MVLENTIESPKSPLDINEVKADRPKGKQPWIFIGRTDAKTEAPILCPRGVKSWLTDAGEDWGKEEKGTSEDEMVR